MDDEEIVTIVVGQMLKSLGYEFNCVETGEEALEKYADSLRSGEAYDAVILDLTVRGGMGGKETISRMFEIDPQVRAIVSSGYSDDPIVANYRDFGFKGVLSKPYEIERLSNVLYSLLAARF
jgi:CheY-like chemotaxis protein